MNKALDSARVVVKHLRPGVKELTQVVEQMDDFDSYRLGYERAIADVLGLIGIVSEAIDVVEKSEE